LKNDKTVLILCRSLNEIPLFSCIRPQPDCRYIVASDDIRVQREAGKHSWVADVCWIEKMETFYDVAEDVLGFLDIINLWLASFGDDQKGIPKELLFWIRHCEGGMTSQRIQDLLLLIWSYQEIIESHNIQGIILLKHPGMEWEDDVFLQTVRTLGISDIQTLGDYGKSLKKQFLSFLKSAFREPYYISNILRTKFRNAFRRPDTRREKEVVFQLFGSALKHVENTVPLMKALKEKGYAPVALCWNAEKYAKKSGAVQVREQGLSADELERFMPFYALIDAPLRLLRTWKKVRQNRQAFLTHPKLRYHSVRLGELLWPSVTYFFSKEILLRYRLREAMRQYFLSHSPLAVKVWGGMEFFESITVLDALKNRDETVVVDGFIAAVGFDWPYFCNDNLADVLLVAGESRKNFLIRNHVPSEQIAVIGGYRYDDLIQFRNTHSPQNSRSFLKIPLTYDLYILFDSNKILRGFMASQEQARITRTLLDFCKAYQNVALMIKPHPGHHPGILESIVESYSLKNVFFIDQTMLPYHAINASDAVITRISAIGTEVMLFEHLLVPVLFNGEKKFEIYGKASETLTNSEMLTHFLSRFAEDKAFREQRTKAAMEKQNAFLEQNLSTGLPQLASQRGADAIDRFIKQKQQTENS
jgi:hypothetical protein